MRGTDYMRYTSQMIKRYGLILGAIGIFAVLVFYIGCRSNSTEDNHLSVRLTWLHQAQFAGIYSAEDKGYYKDEGLDVTVNAGGIEYSSVKMVSAGSDDIGLTSADQVLLGRSKGAPLVALAAMYQRSPVVLFSIKDAGIDSPEKLRQKKIGIKYGDNTEVPVRALLDKYGIGKNDYSEVSVSYDVTPILEGRVDVLPGFSINEPLSLVEKGKQINQIYTADFGVNFYADVIFTREEVLVKNKDLVEKFLRATLKGYQYAINHPDEAITSVLKRSPNANKAHERLMLEASSKLWKPTPESTFGAMDISNWQAIQSYMLNTKLNDGKPLFEKPVDLAKVVNTEILQKASK